MLAVIFQASIVSRETMISHGHVKPKNYNCVFPSNKGKSTLWTIAKESSWRKVEWICSPRSSICPVEDMDISSSISIYPCVCQWLCMYRPEKLSLMQNLTWHDVADLARGQSAISWTLINIKRVSYPKLKPKCHNFPRVVRSLIGNRLNGSRRTCAKPEKSKCATTILNILGGS